VQEFTSKKLGVSLDVPAGWIVEEFSTSTNDRRQENDSGNETIYILKIDRVEKSTLPDCNFVQGTVDISYLAESILSTGRKMPPEGLPLLPHIDPCCNFLFIGNAKN
jgi:hypothetical protein